MFKSKVNKDGHLQEKIIYFENNFLAAEGKYFCSVESYQCLRRNGNESADPACTCVPLSYNFTRLTFPTVLDVLNTPVIAVHIQKRLQLKITI